MNSEQSQKKKPGRPLKNEKDGRRSAHSVWLSDALRMRIGEAAAARGRSMSEEMADRLHESFEREKLASGIVNRALGDAVITTLLLAEIKTGNAWNASDISARYAFTRIVLMLRNIMEVPLAQEISDDEKRELARIFEVIAKAHEEAYREPEGGLGGLLSTYPPAGKSIRDPEGLRWLGHKVGNLDILKMRDKRKNALETGDIEVVVDE